MTDNASCQASSQEMREMPCSDIRFQFDGKMSLRAKQMAKRREALLDSAEALIRETGGTDFSVRLLAENSDLSPVTPYNLFGTKEGLLYSLLLRTVETFYYKNLDVDPCDPPFRPLAIAGKAVDMFANDPKLLRPLYRVLLGASHPDHRPVFMKKTFEYWLAAVRCIPDVETRLADCHIELLARTVMAHFIGELEQWVQQDSDDELFRTRVICGLILTTHGAYHPQHRAILYRHFEELSEKYERICKK